MPVNSGTAAEYSGGPCCFAASFSSAAVFAGALCCCCDLLWWWMMLLLLLRHCGLLLPRFCYAAAGCWPAGPCCCWCDGNNPIARSPIVHSRSFLTLPWQIGSRQLRLGHLLSWGDRALNSTSAWYSIGRLTAALCLLKEDPSANGFLRDFVVEICAPTPIHNSYRRPLVFLHTTTPYTISFHLIRIFILSRYSVFDGWLRTSHVFQPPPAHGNIFEYRCHDRGGDHGFCAVDSWVLSVHLLDISMLLQQEEGSRWRQWYPRMESRLHWYCCVDCSMRASMHWPRESITAFFIEDYWNYAQCTLCIRNTGNICLQRLFKEWLIRSFIDAIP